MQGRFSLVIALVIAFVTIARETARADVFTDIGEGLTRITGLRGVMKGIAGGASEGVREQMDKFVDEKIDPMISRIDTILHDRIQQATESALLAIREMERAMSSIIDQAARRIDELTANFFARLNRALDEAFIRIENLFDTVLCRVMPDGRIIVALGPFGGSDEIEVANPARTHCYRHFLASQNNPSSAKFRRWEFFAGELCENELALDRISPQDPESISKIIAGYRKLSEMANTARCAAPDPTTKIQMAAKLNRYQSRVAFFTRFLEGVRSE